MRETSVLGTRRVPSPSISCQTDEIPGHGQLPEDLEYRQHRPHRSGRTTQSRGIYIWCRILREGPEEQRVPHDQSPVEPVRGDPGDHIRRETPLCERPGPRPDSLLRVTPQRSRDSRDRDLIEIFSLFELDLRFERGRIILKDGGRTIECHTPVADPDYPGYKILGHHMTKTDRPRWLDAGRD